MDITTISTLAAHLAAKHDLNPKDAKNIVTDVFAEIVNSAKRGEIVAIQNFGKFTVKDRKAHQGRNPATGEPSPIPRRANSPTPPARRSRTPSTANKREPSI